MWNRCRRSGTGRFVSRLWWAIAEHNCRARLIPAPGVAVHTIAGGLRVNALRYKQTVPLDELVPRNSGGRYAPRFAADSTQRGRNKRQKVTAYTPHIQHRTTHVSLTGSFPRVGNTRKRPGVAASRQFDKRLQGSSYLAGYCTPGPRGLSGCSPGESESASTPEICAFGPYNADAPGCRGGGVLAQWGIYPCPVDWCLGDGDSGKTTCQWVWTVE